MSLLVVNEFYLISKGLDAPFATIGLIGTIIGVFSPNWNRLFVILKGVLWSIDFYRVFFYRKWEPGSTRGSRGRTDFFFTNVSQTHCYIMSKVEYLKIRNSFDRFPSSSNAFRFSFPSLTGFRSAWIGLFMWLTFLTFHWMNYKESDKHSFSYYFPTTIITFSHGC